jgi:hypothetical protein
MSLDEALLEKLANWRPPEGRQTLLVSDPGDGWGLTLTADRADPVG